MCYCVICVICVRACVHVATCSLMFWSDWGSEPKIERSDMAGKNRMVLVRDSEIVRLGWPNGLTIDYSTDRLYWADAREDVIERINLDGTNRVVSY